jgi:hypothetical protein
MSLSASSAYSLIKYLIDLLLLAHTAALGARENLKTYTKPTDGE